jgi:hypothetical protein
MGAQKNFSIFMSELPELFPKDWKPDRDFYQRCVSQAILFRGCERIVRARKFAAYRANIAVYTFALLSHVSKGEVNLDYIWNSQEISPELESIFDEWTQRVDAEIRGSAGAKNVTEWCKKGECWEAVRALPVTVNPPELPEISRKATSSESPPQRKDVNESGAAGAVDSTENWGDEDAIEECMQHDAATWAKLNFWGVSNNSLDYYERGVAHTLSEYAALNWVRKPSAKQARIGVRVLRRGRDAELL